MWHSCLFGFCLFWRVIFRWNNVSVNPWVSESSHFSDWRLITLLPNHSYPTVILNTLCQVQQAVKASFYLSTWLIACCMGLRLWSEPEELCDGSIWGKWNSSLNKNEFFWDRNSCTQIFQFWKHIGLNALQFSAIINYNNGLKFWNRFPLRILVMKLSHLFSAK